MPIVADAAAAVRADMTGFNRDLQQGGEKATKTLGQQLKSVFSPKNLAVAGVAGGIALAGAITAGLADAVRSLIDIERLNAQTDAAIRSTGGAAKITRKEIEDMAEGIESVTTVERESVQEGANLLLTFKNIRNEAGDGNDIFNQATQAMVDLGVAMGTDTASGAIQLGKALNDPVKGIAALSRVGITFTKDQEEMIRSLVETGDILSAQKIILNELESQFGGSAEAFADTTAGKIQRFQNDVGNMFESIVLGAATVADAVGDAGEDLGTSVDIAALHFGDLGDRANGMADRFGTSFDDIKKRVRKRMEETGETVDEALTFVEGRFYEAGNTIPTTMDEGMRATHQVVQDRADELMKVIPDAVLEHWQEIHDAGVDSVAAYNKGLFDSQGDLLAEADALLKKLDEGLEPGEEISLLRGKKMSLMLARGIEEGKDVPDLGAIAAIDALIADINARLNGLNGYNYGKNLALTISQGIRDYTESARISAYALGGIIRAGVGINSEPEDPNSPLRGITKWGGNMVKTIAEGIYGELGTAASATSALAGSLVPVVGTPSFAPTGAAAGVAAGVGMGGTTYILQVEGREKVVGSREEVLAAWEQMASFDGGPR